MPSSLTNSIISAERSSCGCGVVGLLEQVEVEEAGPGVGDAHEDLLGLGDREQELVADVGQQPAHGTRSRASSVDDAGARPASTAWPRAR